MSKETVATAAFTGCSAILSLVTLMLVFGIRADASHLSTGPMQERWEYIVVALPDPSFEADAKKLGDEGWEIITARRASNERDEYSYEVIAKRRTSRAATSNP